VDAVRKKRLPATFEVIEKRGHFELVQAIGTSGDRTTDLITRFVLEPPAPARAGLPGRAARSD
ncbi:MAG: hypothetical protein ACT4PY_10300, partial [Armatimonadota bacterium]